MNKISWKIIIVFGLLFLFFMLYLFPVYQAEINKIVGSEVQSLDARFSYTKSDVLSLFQTLKEEGRNKMRLMSGVIDMIFPIVYGVLFFLLLKKLMNNSVTNNKNLKIIPFLPLISAIFDYVENFSVLNMLNSFPVITDTQVLISFSATSLKWIFLVASLLFILVISVEDNL